jgi:hypothetical protein
MPSIQLRYHLALWAGASSVPHEEAKHRQYSIVRRVLPGIR